VFKFLKNGVPKDAPDSVAASEPFAESETVGPQSVSRPSDFRHELIRVVLKDTLRRRGVPYDWLSCEVFLVPRGPRQDEVHVQLMLLKWNELFLRYLSAFETQLVQGLDRFEPAVDHSAYIISWRFSPDCGCPFTVMPPPLIWAHDAAPPLEQEEAPSILDRRKSRRAPKKPESVEAARAQPSPQAPPEDAAYEQTRLSPLR
jgi:hypothetical protein